MTTSNRLIKLLQDLLGHILYASMSIYVYILYIYTPIMNYWDSFTFGAGGIPDLLGCAKSVVFPVKIQALRFASPRLRDDYEFMAKEGCFSVFFPDLTGTHGNL